MSGITCLVTIHGIGFQQPGYADQPHRLLHASGRLPGLVDDPDRLPDAHGPIYVQRPWKEKEDGALDRRDDVDKIVIDAHSQGTVLALDVLGRYVPDKLAGLITAGSPLGKYVDLFAWEPAS